MRAFALICLVFAIAGGIGRGEEEPPPRVLRVGIHDKPPYATKSSAGEWKGIAVDLWKSISLRTGIRFEFVETPFGNILTDVGSGKLDAACGEIEVTAPAEKLIDFTQPFLMSSIGVALPLRPSSHQDWIAIAKEFFNWTLVEVVLAILAGMVLVSLLIWYIERNHHVGHFRGGLSGFGSALWFSAVTMTTVGYGDKTPSTFLGRLVSFFWMLAGVILVASFTAAVASSASAARLGDTITRPSDLFRLKCGVMQGSVPESFLLQHGIPAPTFPTNEAALKALSDGKLDAVVADRVSLRYLARSMAGKQPPVIFRVSPVGFQDTFIAIPVHTKLPEFKAINEALLDTTASEEWRETLHHWLGHDRE